MPVNDPPRVAASPTPPGYGWIHREDGPSFIGRLDGASDPAPEVKHYLGDKEVPGCSNSRCVGLAFAHSGPCNTEGDKVTALLAERGKSYDAPERNFERIAGMWRALFGWDVTASQVGQAMICVKQSREWFAHKQDNLDDIAGYAECIRLIEEARALR